MIVDLFGLVKAAINCKSEIDNDAFAQDCASALGDERTSKKVNNCAWQPPAILQHDMCIKGAAIAHQISFARSVAPLVHSLIPHCSLRSRAPLRSFVPSLAHSEAKVKVSVNRMRSSHTVSTHCASLASAVWATKGIVYTKVFLIVLSRLGYSAHHVRR